MELLKATVTLEPRIRWFFKFSACNSRCFSHLPKNSNHDVTRQGVKRNSCFARPDVAKDQQKFKRRYIITSSSQSENQGEDISDCCSPQISS